MVAEVRHQSTSRIPLSHAGLSPVTTRPPTGSQHFPQVLDEALIGVLAAGLLVAAAAVVRVRASVDRRVDAATAELAEAAGFASEYAASLDADEILQRTLAAIAALPRIDGALVVLEWPEGPRTAALGLTEEEAERVALQMPRNANLRSMEVAYRYRLDEVGEASSLPRAGLIVPLRAEGHSLGTLCAVTRSPERAFAPATGEALEALARRAGPAFANARRFEEIRRLADLDSLTGLHNRRSFHELLAREVARARRYERGLALIMLDLDDFKRVNDRIGHLAGDAVLAEVAERLRSVVRSTDLPARIGGDEFAVILPESSHEEAELLAGRIAKAVATEEIVNAGILKISAGVAELGPEDTATSLFELADNELYAVKGARKTRGKTA
jgi:diguanylate cyclase (GGDEF)-like protein